MRVFSAESGRHAVHSTLLNQWKILSQDFPLNSLTRRSRAQRKSPLRDFPLNSVEPVAGFSTESA